MTKYLAAPQPEFLHPDDVPPPRGTKLNLLTSGGIATFGHWTDDSNLIAWAPLIKVSDDLRARLRNEGKLL